MTLAHVAARSVRAARLAKGPLRCFHARQLVGDALRQAREQLQRAADAAVSDKTTPIASTRDAKPLVAHALEPPLRASNELFLHLDRQLTQTEAHTLTAALARRCRGEPLAYVTGTREFWSRDFVVTPSTLIPRSDSEVLIETLVEQYPVHAELRILDIGTGSGCLLVTALGEFPQATGVGIDISSDALAVAEQNAERHGVSRRVTLLQQDLRALPALLQQHQQQKDGSASTAIAALFQQFDVILCNPPYIPRSELHLVAPDVLAHEPHLALFSDGPNAASASNSGAIDGDPLGLQMYQSLQQSVVHLLAPDRRRERSRSHHRQQQCVVLEVGSEAQARAVRALFASAPSLLRCERVLLDSQQRHRGLLLSRP